MKIKLCNPKFTKKYSLVDAIKNRRTSRRFKNTELDMTTISEMLYICCGETKKKTKKSKNRRTIPSARNSQCVNAYIVLKEGIYLYTEETHELIFICKGDHRSRLSTQKMMSNAPFGILFVADYSKLTMYAKSTKERMMQISYTEVGCMSQNLYLYATAKKLGTVLVGLVERDYFHALLDLNEYQEVLYSQIVGFVK